MSLEEISLGSKCLRKYHLTDDVVSLHPNAALAQSVMQRSYTRMSNVGYKPTWRSIVGWVDKLVFVDVDMNNTFDFEEGRKRSEYILKFLSRWYNEYLLPEQDDAWVDLTLEHHFDRFCVYGYLPIVKLQEERPVISLVSDRVVATQSLLYNDIVLRGMMWLVEKALDCGEIVLEYLTIGPEGGFDRQLIYSVKEDNDRAGKMIKDVGSLIYLGIDYPSVTDDCNTCQFRRRCRV